MELLRFSLWPLLGEGPDSDGSDPVSVPQVFFSALRVGSSSDEQAPTPTCDSILTFSLENKVLPESSRNINSRSLSPWSWRSTTLKDQIPSTLWEAECSSTFCSSPDLGQTDHQNLNSVPVYQNILVLNRRQNESCYTASYRSVAVGCTCVRAKTSHS
ncbi:interleukin-17A-like [Nothobranchius furzeri]|uniref:Interleukin-17A-like n=1 Tax=Nothobranchius furzeri TaxID=105023 RepID=A0A9D2Y210_NOTFU|nr:interleukin-17A-like [Nothobranchius furzeri]